MRFLILLYLFGSNNLFAQTHPISDDRFVSHVVNLKESQLELFWKDGDGNIYESFKNLKEDLADQKKNLVFAMNGGMYLKDRSPQGLFIQNGVEKKKMNTVEEAFGNFYLQPNGVFYINKDNTATISQRSEYPGNKDVLFATQSGPMLVINGNLHPAFNQGSKNLHIRNAVGILPDGRILFVMSKNKINFYDIATYFKNLGCQNALYLDGFVSRTYLPSANWNQLDGKFGVIIGEVNEQTSVK